MNFALMISCKVEEKLEAVERNAEWSQNDEAVAYESALKEVLAEDGRAWADGNIRVGDYILISESPFPIPTPPSTQDTLSSNPVQPQSTPTRASPPTASSTPSRKWSTPPTWA